MPNLPIIYSKDYTKYNDKISENPKNLSPHLVLIP